VEKPRRKGQFSIKEALGMTLGLCMGIALIRASYTQHDASLGLIGVASLLCTFGAVVAIVCGRNPSSGAAWGLIAIVMVPGMLMAVVAAVVFVLLILSR
jgi:hypothetical protein